MATPSLSKVYAEIVRGKSEVRWGDKAAYLKHFTCFDQAELDEYETQEKATAIKRGIPSREAKEKWLIENGLWSAKEERELGQQRDYLRNMDKTREKLMSKSQVSQHDEAVKAETKRYNEMYRKKDSLFGLTAEDCANRRLQFYQIHLSFYEDAALTKRLFPQRDDLDDEESVEVLNAFIEAITPFSRDSIRRVAVSPFFLNAFYLCGDDPTRFLGKPLVELSIWQTSLISSGLHFKQIFSNHEVPDHIAAHPDKIDEWLQQVRNIKDAAARHSGEGSTGLMAGSGEMEAAGLNVDTQAAMSLKKD